MYRAVTRGLIEISGSRRCRFEDRKIDAVDGGRSHAGSGTAGLVGSQTSRNSRLIGTLPYRERRISKIGLRLKRPWNDKREHLQTRLVV